MAVPGETLVVGFAVTLCIITLTEGSSVAKKTKLAVADLAQAIFFVVTGGLSVAGGAYIQQEVFTENP